MNTNTPPKPPAIHAPALARPEVPKPPDPNKKITITFGQFEKIMAAMRVQGADAAETQCVSQSVSGDVREIMKQIQDSK